MPVDPLVLFKLLLISDTATTEIYTLSLHDALPILSKKAAEMTKDLAGDVKELAGDVTVKTKDLAQDVTAKTKDLTKEVTGKDRKSTRLNSSHVKISYAVFCLKKKIIKKDYVRFERK